MPVTIKSAREIELMKEAGRILEIVHDELGKALHPGMTTLDIDRLGEEIIRSYGCEPSFLNYNGYPASICVSVNDEVVHGIPKGMTLAIEPMINIGGYAVNWLDDDWTVVTRDGSLSAHYENTVLITEDEPILLTLSK